MEEAYYGAMASDYNKLLISIVKYFNKKVSFLFFSVERNGIMY